MISNITGIKPETGYLADVTKPFAWWSLAANPTGTPTLTSLSDLPSWTAAGTPDYATTPGWATLDGSTEHYTSADATDAELRSLLNIGEGVLLVWAQVNLATGADTAADIILAVNDGAASCWSYRVQRSGTGSSGTICTAYPSIAFDGDAGGQAVFGYSPNQYSVNEVANIAALIDNRPAGKTVYVYANGIQAATGSLSGKPGCNIANAATQRVRIGANAAGTAGNLHVGGLRRLGVMNFGDTMPAGINAVVNSLNLSGGVPTRELLLSGA